MKLNYLDINTLQQTAIKYFKIRKQDCSEVNNNNRKNYTIHPKQDSATVQVRCLKFEALSQILRQNTKQSKTKMF